MSANTPITVPIYIIDLFCVIQDILSFLQSRPNELDIDPNPDSNRNQYQSNNQNDDLDDLFVTSFSRSVLFTFTLQNCLIPFEAFYEKDLVVGSKVGRRRIDWYVGVVRSLNSPLDFDS